MVFNYAPRSTQPGHPQAGKVSTSKSRHTTWCTGWRLQKEISAALWAIRLRERILPALHWQHLWYINTAQPWAQPLQHSTQLMWLMQTGARQLKTLETRHLSASLPVGCRHLHPPSLNVKTDTQFTVPRWRHESAQLPCNVTIIAGWTHYYTINTTSEQKTTVRRPSNSQTNFCETAKHGPVWKHSWQWLVLVGSGRTSDPGTAVANWKALNTCTTIPGCRTSWHQTWRLAQIVWSWHGRC